MISFSILYIFLSLIIVVGVIFLIHGLSQKPTRRRLELNYLENEISTETQLSKEVIFDLQLEEGGKVPRYGDPEIPERFDPEFIQKQLAKVQRSPNVISAYLNNLEVRFRTAQEMKILKQMKNYNDLVADGTASESRIYKERKGLQRAILEWKREQKEGFQQLLDKEAETDIMANIAKNEAKIRKYNSRYSPQETQQQQNTRPSPEEFRERQRRQFAIKAEDMTALDQDRRDYLNKLDRRMQEELEDLEDGPWSGEEKERKIDEIYARYARQREEILTMKPRRG